MTPATTDEQIRFISLLPEIESRLSHRFTCDPAEKEERIAVSVGHAFLLFLSAVRRNKRVTASTLAFYSAKMTYSGRLVGSRQSKYEVLATRTGEIPLPLSLSENDLADLLEDRKNGWSPADRVAFEIDWMEFMDEQSRRDRDIVGLLAKGYRRSEAAHAVGISRPAVTQRMSRLKDQWGQFEEDALH